MEKLLSVRSLLGCSVGRKCREKNDAADVGLSYGVSGGSLRVPWRLSGAVPRLCLNGESAAAGQVGLHLGLP